MDGAYRAVVEAVFRCRLVAGVELRRRGRTSVLTRSRPVTVVEVSERARRLLARGAAAGLSRPSAGQLQFLRHLAELGLIEFWADVGEWPSVSVIVPARGRRGQLEACLAALGGLHYPTDRLELWVVDDGSTPPLTVPAGVRLLRRERSGGPAAARNLGAGSVRSDVLAFVDSDCLPDPRWLSSLVAELADPAVAAAGGRLLPARPGGSWLERYDATRSQLDLGAHYAEARPRDRVPYLVSASLAVRRSAFEEVGGFEEALRFGEDVDLSWRLHARGHRLVYQPRALVRHHHRGSVRAFVTTRANYAASEAALLERHPAQGRWLTLTPGLLVALGGTALALGGRRRLLAPCLGFLAAEAAAGVVVTGRETGLPPHTNAGALARGYGSGTYHVGRQLARYYAWVGLLAARRRPRLLGPLAAALVGTALVDWARLRPPLRPAAFVAASLLDDLAYQWGTLWGCLREATLAPLRVQLRIGYRNREPRPARRAETRISTTSAAESAPKRACREFGP